MPAMPEVEAGTSSVTGPDAPASPRPDGRQGTAKASGEFDVPHQMWQLKDSSASGCRLRGAIANPNRVLPGTLLAFRERDNLPWTLAVVRRLRKRIGDRVDIGVEYVGQNPLGVTLATESDPPGQSNAAPDKKRKQCTALFLRESSEHPKMPFRTLILLLANSRRVAA